MAGPAGRYQLGPWRVDPDLGLIRQADVSRRLPPRAMDVLVCLLEQPGAVVSPAMLVDRAWAGRVVEESSVYQRIAQIRRALGDDRGQPAYIESIPRRGYRIIAPVRPLAADGTESADGDWQTGPAPVPVAEARRRLVAVLPLRDLTPGEHHGWLAEGLTEQLRLQIGVWHRFNVLPGTLLRSRSIDDLPEGVDYLIDGYLQIDGDQVCLGLDVIDVARRSSIWSDSFRGQFGQQLELQRRIATHIANLFGLSVSPLPAPTNPAALEPFLRFVRVWSYGSYDDTRYWLEQTLARDPAWSWGWAELAGLLLRIGSVLSDHDYLHRARCILLEQARTPKPSSQVTIVQSWLRGYWEGDLAGAEQLLRPLAAKGLTWPYGMLMLTSGLVRESEACFHRLTQERPYLTVAWEMLLWARLIVGDGAGAIEAGRQIVRLYPDTAINSASLLAHALAVAGDLSAAGKARADLERRTAHLPDGPQRRLTERGLARLAFLLSRRRGQTDEARAAARRIAQLGQHAEACVMLLSAGDHSRAAAELQRVDPDLERFWWWAAMVNITDELEAHPVLAALRERLGLTAAWRRELERRAATNPTTALPGRPPT